MILNNQGTRNRIRFTRELQVSQIQALVPIQKLLKRNLTMTLTLNLNQMMTMTMTLVLITILLKKILEMRTNKNGDNIQIQNKSQTKNNQINRDHTNRLFQILAILQFGECSWLKLYGPNNGQDNKIKDLEKDYEFWIFMNQLINKSIL